MSDEPDRTDREARYLGVPGEQSYGYAQAVRVGHLIFVSGQSAFVDGEPVPLDMSSQMRRCYEKIVDVLALYDATIDDVVEETLYVTDHAAASAVAGELRHDVYGGVPAVASTLCQIAALGTPQLMIEIKCTALWRGA